MGVLDDKVAIVTGAPAASAARRPSCSSEQGAKVLINDLDADVASRPPARSRARPSSTAAT